VFVCYCEKFGLTSVKREARLAMLDLSQDDYPLALLLQKDVIEPNIEVLLASFYDKLLQDNAVRSVIDQGFSISRLKNTQKIYVLSLGKKFAKAAYFESRLKIGQVHLRIGIRPSLYQCAYRILQELLIQHIPAEHPQYSQLISFVLKITTLDMSLAIEAYEYALAEGWTRHADNDEKRTQNLSESEALDPLTGVLSRSRFLQVFNKRFADAQGDIPISMILMNLDQLREIIAAHGNVIGDQILQHVADRIRSSVRVVNAIGRFSEEEFIIVLHNIALDEGRSIAERVKAKLAARPIKINQLVIPVTVSIGLACTEGNESADNLISRTRTALNEGRDCAETDASFTSLLE